MENIDKESVAEEELGINKIHPFTTTNSEAKYYHVDKYLNQLMDLQLELNDTILKSSSFLTELDHVQQKVKFRSKPNSGTLLLAEASLK